jgi:Holin of 3TMs, for gene-transfer release
MFLEQTMDKEEVKEEVKVEKPQEDWMTKKWRPMMAVMYMISCVFDFVIFPIMFTIVQFWETSIANDAFRQWAPITLQGGGLFHVAMGAVLGVSAWSRGQEKMAGVASGPAAPAHGMNRMSQQPMQQPMNRVEPSFTQQYEQPQSGYNGTSASDFDYNNQQPARVTVGYGGKSAPPPAPQPLL